MLGGLPPGEYVLHVILAMVFGALVTSVIYDAGSWSALPSGIAYQPAAVPAAIRLIMAIMAVLVFYSGIQDLRAALRLKRVSRATSDGTGRA